MKTNENPRRPSVLLLTHGSSHISANSAAILHVREETEREWKCGMCVQPAVSDGARLDDMRVLGLVICVFSCLSGLFEVAYFNTATDVSPASLQLERRNTAAS